MNDQISREQRDWLRTILELTDPIGVLSVYVDADPALAAGTPPAWNAPVRSGLRCLVKEAQEAWPRDARFALEARLEELEPDLEWLLDPLGPSRGRALFAGVGGGTPERVGFRSPLPSLVSFGHRAIVLPLLAARQEGRPAGVATVLWDRLELSEWELAELRELETIELETEPDRVGSRPATNPSVPQPFPERDRFETGHGARIAARVRKAGEDLSREAGARHWDYVVVDGDPRLLDAFETGFGAGESELVRSPRPFAGTPDADISDRVASMLRELREATTKQLVAKLESSGAATTDAAVVERALGEGRVDHLLLAKRTESARAPAAESLLRRAFETGAAVTLVDPLVLGHGDVAALLRW